MTLWTGTVEAVGEREKLREKPKKKIKEERATMASITRNCVWKEEGRNFEKKNLFFLFFKRRRAN